MTWSDDEYGHYQPQCRPASAADVHDAYGGRLDEPAHARPTYDGRARMVQSITRDLDKADAPTDFHLALRGLHGALLGQPLAAAESLEVARMVDVEADSTSKLNADCQTESAREVAMSFQAVLVAEAAREHRRGPHGN